MTLLNSYTFWHGLTRLGEAPILLPAAVLLAVWLVARAHDARMALYWFGSVGVATFITTATKVAFIGWGVGSATLDFTGVSGHTMFAAAIYPMLARSVAAHARPRLQNFATAFGVVLALLIGYSRLRVNAHSLSEVVAGLVVGFGATAFALMLARLPKAQAPRWLVLALVAWFAAMPIAAPPSPTHGLVTRLALALSGRDAPFTRHDLHRAAAPLI